MKLEIIYGSLMFGKATALFFISPNDFDFELTVKETKDHDHYPFKCFTIENKEDWERLYALSAEALKQFEENK